jgi:hypothetical protein
MKRTIPIAGLPGSRFGIAICLRFATLALSKGHPWRSNRGYLLPCVLLGCFGKGSTCRPAPTFLPGGVRRGPVFHKQMCKEGHLGLRLQETERAAT